MSNKYNNVLINIMHASLVVIGYFRSKCKATEWVSEWVNVV